MTPQAWKKVHRAVLGLITGLVVLVTVLPIVWMVIASLQTGANLSSGRFDLFHLQFRNYSDMWRNVNFGLFFRNSLIICSATMLIAGFFATLAGYAMARYRFKGSDLYGFTIIGTQMIPGIMFLLPIYMIFLWVKQTTGLPMVNTFWGMIAVYTAFFTPMSIWIMRGFFASIPRELEEAALIDGCTPFFAFLRVILPLSVPGLIATGVYIFLTAWDELLFAWVLTTSKDVATIPIGIRLYVGQFQNRYDLLMAAATVTTIPVLITFFATQKWFISGMTAGSVKG
ncbi:MAG TPA: carbohydrate ABC transporter permease [Symbiobacteriaceae bacterium]|nr:carbohydrate ABC transporter permease [Symbiobacteriaceae bacterium]